MTTTNYLRDKDSLTDLEFIEYLVRLLWDDVTDGDTPEQKDFTKIEDELRARDLDPESLMGY